MTNSLTRKHQRENLALIFQEVLTAIVRLRSDRQPVSDPNAFRHFILEALKGAARQASVVGYNAGDIKSATFAAVAFLDESILNKRKPTFDDWLRKPLQEELFGTHVAGDVFFDNAGQLLSRADSMDLADLLEIYYLCLLLGFSGRHSANRGELKQVKDSISEKIDRIRPLPAALAPASTPPKGEVKNSKDPWLFFLKIASVVCAALMLVLFVSYKVTLHSAIVDLREAPAQTRK
jgi:type VI secretion system protein ImpK